MRQVLLTIALLLFAPVCVVAQESALSRSGGGSGTVSTAGGSGTASVIPKFTSSTVLSDSFFVQGGDATNARFIFNSAAATHPMFRRNATAVEVKLADNSAFAPLSLSTLVLNGATSGTAALAAAATTTSYTLTLPSAVPGANASPLLISTAGAASYPTGTPDGTKFLRDDGSWQAAGIDLSGVTDSRLLRDNAGTVGESLLSDDATNVTLTSGQFLAPTSGVSAPSFATSSQPDSGLHVTATGVTSVMANGHTYITGNGTQYIYLSADPTAPNIAFYDDGFFAPDAASVDLGGQGEAGSGLNRFRSVNLGGNTVTTSRAPLDIAQAWNAGGVTFRAVKVNITDTASASGSLLQDLQVGAVSKFSVRKDGLTTIATSDSGTTDTVDGFVITRNTSGTADAGFGVGALLRLEDDGGTLEDAARISATWVDDSAASEDSGIDFGIRTAGGAVTDYARLWYNNSGAELRSLSGSISLYAGGMSGTVSFSSANGTYDMYLSNAAQFLPYTTPVDLGDPAIQRWGRAQVNQLSLLRVATAAVGNFTFTFNSRTEGGIREATLSDIDGTHTATLTSPLDGGFYVFSIIQDASDGNETVTWPASVKWAGGVAPTLTTAASARDVFHFYSDGTNFYELGRFLDVK